jgi:hypothetical protein
VDNSLADLTTSVFIVFEGIDGTGKTVQVRLLKEALERAGENPVVSREPTDGPWGRLIKESAATGRLSPEQELDAFLRDRTEHVNTVVGSGKSVSLRRRQSGTEKFSALAERNVRRLFFQQISQFGFPQLFGAH